MTIQELAIKITIDDEASKGIDDVSTKAIAKAKLVANAVDAIGNAITNAAKKLVDFVSGSVQAYAQYEQMVGGVEALFKGASDTVIENAKNAYETAGISASKYMEQINSFSNALIEGVAKNRAGIVESTQDVKKATTEFKRANEDAYNAESRRLSDLVEDKRRALQDEYDARRQQLSDEESDLRRSQAEEVESFKDGVNARVRLMEQERDEKIRVIDEELQARLDAIDAELKALDQQENDQNDEMKERERSRKLATLRENVEYAGTIDQRKKAEKEYSEYLEKIRDDDAKEARRRRRTELREERSDAKEKASKEKTQVKSEYAEAIDAFKEHQSNILKEIQESQSKQLEEMRLGHQQELRDLQRANDDQLKEMQRANEDALREIKRRNSDAETENKASLANSAEYVEKVQEDYEEAARLGDVAMRDMSDNANRYGTDLGRLQDAYQGFMRGEFRMLDNLKLGYGGTKGEMQELLEYAEELAERSGEAADYSIDSFPDIIEAIHRVQDELGTSGYGYDELKKKMEDHSLTERELHRISQDIWLSKAKDYKSEEQAYADVVKRYNEGSLDIKEALILAGTTSYEAKETLQGSWNAAQGAWENFLVALADPDGDIESATTNLVDKVSVAVALLIPVVGRVLENLKKQVVEKAPEIWETFRKEVLSLIPDEAKEKFKDFIDFITGFATEVQGVIDFFDGVRQVVEPIVKLFGDLGKVIGDIGGKVANFLGGGFQQEIEAAGRENASTEKLRTLLREIGKEAGDQLDEGFMEQVENGDLATLASLAAKVRNTPELKDAMKNAAESSEYQFQTSLQNAFENGTNQYVSSGLPSEIQASASKGIGKDTLSPNASEMMSGMTDSMRRGYDEQTGPYVESLSEKVRASASGLNKDLLSANGKESMEGLVDGSEDAWVKRRDFYKKISPWIYQNDGPLEEHRNLLKEHGRQTILGLIDGSRSAWEGNRSFFSDLPTSMSNAVGNVGTTLTSKGSDILEGFRSGADNVWDSVSRWFGGLPSDAYDTVGDVSSTLRQRGDDIIRGFNDGVSNAWWSVSSFFYNLSESVSGAVGWTGNVLFDAGVNIMRGFQDGLESMWSNIQSWVNRIGDWIRENKGPKQYDLNLLVPNGRWIMQGLSKGMRDAFPMIRDAVSDISDMMSIDQSLSFGGFSKTPQARDRALPPINIYMDYNAGEDGTKLVNDMVSQMRLYGYTMGGR